MTIWVLYLVLWTWTLQDFGYIMKSTSAGAYSEKHAAKLRIPQLLVLTLQQWCLMCTTLFSYPNISIANQWKINRGNIHLQLQVSFYSGCFVVLKQLHLQLEYPWQVHYVFAMLVNRRQWDREHAPNAYWVTWLQVHRGIKTALSPNQLNLIAREPQPCWGMQSLQYFQGHGIHIYLRVTSSCYINVVKTASSPAIQTDWQTNRCCIVSHASGAA